MPIATAKWQKRCARQATEQRARARARLLGKPLAPPPRPSNITTSYQQPVYYNGFDLNVYTIPQYFQYYPPPGNCQTILTTTFNNQGYYNMPITTQTQGVWDIWNNGGYNTGTGSGSYTPIVWDRWNEEVNLTAEQREAARVAQEARRAADLIARQELERLYAVAQEERAVADKRALELFLSVLRPDELESYKKEQCIYVRGSRGRRYRIRCGHGQAGNVDWLDEKGNKLASLCCHPREIVPHPDAWMVQKLTLEHDEDHFTQLANYSPMPGVRIPAFR